MGIVTLFVKPESSPQFSILALPKALFRAYVEQFLLFSIVFYMNALVNTSPKYYYLMKL